MKAIPIVALLLTMLGCMPKSITLQLSPDSGKVREHTVLHDVTGGPKVAQIDISGVIGETQRSTFGSKPMIDDIAAMLDHAEHDPAVKAVILRINSPGGSVAASETISSLIVGFKQRTHKPVVVSMAEVAASGGYFISLPADTIIAQPATITGSVGVIVPTINISDGLSRLGITARSLTSGPNKDIADPLQPANETHYAILQGIVDEFYTDFRQRVITARPNLENPDSVLDGRIYTGRQALKLGLVDQLGGIREAFDAAKQLAGLSSARLVKYHRDDSTPRTPYARAQADTPAPKAQGLDLIGLPKIERRIEPGFYYLWLPPGSLVAP